jgi:hypothetical protein
MRRTRFLVTAAAVPALAAGAFAAASAAASPHTSAAAPQKVTICHKTGSGSFRRITISSRAWTSPASAAGKQLRKSLLHVGDAVVVGNAACPSSSATPQASDQAPAKITICHATHSKKHPYNRITISSRAVTNPNSQAGSALHGHARHTGDILMPGNDPCPSASGASTGGGQAATLHTNLAPVTGATGSGTATFTIRMGKSQLCYSLSVDNLGSTVTAAHIHRGSNDAIVVPLTAPTSGSSSGCVSVAKSLLREIVASPGAFYTNVHTSNFPSGQVRGDLSS